MSVVGPLKKVNTKANRQIMKSFGNLALFRVLARMRMQNSGNFNSLGNLNTSCVALHKTFMMQFSCIRYVRYILKADCCKYR